MLAGVYTPQWCSLALEDGREIKGITFITDPEHPLYESCSALNTVAALISQATGVLGTNAEYLFSLDSALEQHRIPQSQHHTAGALRASNSANKVTVIIDVYFLIVS